jgi:hypothetical protein
MKTASDGEGGVRGYLADSETGELGESVLMRLSLEEEHASVEGEGGLCIAQRRRIVGKGMMRWFVDASMSFAGGVMPTREVDSSDRLGVVTNKGCE